MQILNFTEPLVKPALQDKSKCFMIRKAWDWLDSKKTRWREQQECRHKVGEVEQLMWMQRGKNGVCENCANSICARAEYGYENSDCFSKVFGVGKIVRTQKIWMKYKGRDGLVICNSDSNPLEIITEGGIFFKRDTPSISQQDGFKNPVDFKNFFLDKYQILLREQMPFWRIKWEWQ